MGLCFELQSRRTSERLRRTQLTGKMTAWRRQAMPLFLRAAWAETPKRPSRKSELHFIRACRGSLDLCRLQFDFNLENEERVSARVVSCNYLAKNISVLRHSLFVHDGCLLLCYLLLNLVYLICFHTCIKISLSFEDFHGYSIYTTDHCQYFTAASFCVSVERLDLISGQRDIAEDHISFH